MPKMIIDLRDNVNETNFKRGDMLVYDATKGDFYTVTEESFFDKTNTKINEIIEENRKNTESLKQKYDDVVANLIKENEELKQENKEFTLKIKESNGKLIDMVENFIKGGNN